MPNSKQNYPKFQVGDIITRYVEYDRKGHKILLEPDYSFLIIKIEKRYDINCYAWKYYKSGIVSQDGGRTSIDYIDSNPHNYKKIGHIKPNDYNVFPKSFKVKLVEILKKVLP